MKLPALKVSFGAAPNWGPLERALDRSKHGPRDACLGDFMFMGLVETEHENIYMYKHVLTRCYLNISGNGDFFCYSEENGKDAYEVITRSEAMGRCFGFQNLL